MYGVGLSVKANAGCTSALGDENEFVTDSDVDDDFEAWMNQIALNVNDGDDYQPFPSKMLALLLFPVHGPHPFVII